MLSASEASHALRLDRAMCVRFLATLGMTRTQRLSILTTDFTACVTAIYESSLPSTKPVGNAAGRSHVLASVMCRPFAPESRNDCMTSTTW